jgi:hypothetical protein
VDQVSAFLLLVLCMPWNWKSKSRHGDARALYQMLVGMSTTVVWLPNVLAYMFPQADKGDFQLFEKIDVNIDARPAIDLTTREPVLHDVESHDPILPVLNDIEHHDPIQPVLNDIEHHDPIEPTPIVNWVPVKLSFFERVFSCFRPI